MGVFDPLCVTPNALHDEPLNVVHVATANDEQKIERAETVRSGVHGDSFTHTFVLFFAPEANVLPRAPAVSRSFRVDDAADQTLVAGSALHEDNREGLRILFSLRHAPRDLLLPTIISQRDSPRKAILRLATLQRTFPPDGVNRVRGNNVLHVLRQKFPFDFNPARDLLPPSE